MATGADGNAYFALDATSTNPNEIGELNTTTGVMTYSPTPSQPASTYPGIDLRSLINIGNDLYFAEYNHQNFTSSIGVLNPTTHAITEFLLPVQGAAIGGITQGADGNIYFTDQANNAIGKFVVNDPAHLVTEAILPKLNQFPTAIVTAPNGLIFYGYNAGFGSYDPTTGTFNQAALPVQAPYLATINQFAVGGDGMLYLSLQSTPPPREFSTFYQLASIDPTATPSTAGVTVYAADTATSVAAGPDGNIAFADLTGELGEFDVTSKSATTTPTPGPNYFARTVTAPGDGYLIAGAVGGLDIALTITAGEGSITGTVENDPFGTTAGTTPGPYGAPGQVVYLVRQGLPVTAPPYPTAVTDSKGTYVFNGVAPGTYAVRLALYPGAYEAYPLLPGPGGGQYVTVTGGQSVAVGLNFGIGVISPLMPLTHDANAFGAGQPDIQTAEVTADYNVILGRAPDPAGLASGVAYLKGGGSLQALAAGLLDSTEFLTKVVSGFYTDFLGRSGSPAEVGSWITAMQTYGLSEEQVAADFLASPEFNADHTDNLSFVQALYEDLLGRQGSVGELSAWLTNLAGGVTRAQVVDSFIYSNESLQNALQVPAMDLDGISDPSPAITAVQAGNGTIAQQVAIYASLPTFVYLANKAVSG